MDDDDPLPEGYTAPQKALHAAAPRALFFFRSVTHGLPFSFSPCSPNTACARCSAKMGGGEDKDSFSLVSPGFPPLHLSRRPAHACACCSQRCRAPRDARTCTGSRSAPCAGRGWNPRSGDPSFACIRMPLCLCVGVGVGVGVGVRGRACACMRENAAG
jgi:hypothetical protein